MGLTKGATSGGGGSTSLGPDLAAIAALSPPTAAFGRSLLSTADAAAIQALVIPAGTVWATAGASADAGWLLCDGLTVTGGQTTYPALWARIPASWKSGANIVLPDLRGRTIIGAGTGTSLTARTLGTVQPASAPNEETHTLTSAESYLPAHTHPLSITTANSTGSGALGVTVSGTTAANGNHVHYPGNTAGMFVTSGYNHNNSDDAWIPITGGSYGTQSITGSAVGGSADGNGNHTHTVTSYGSAADHTHPVNVGGTASSNSVQLATAHNNMQPSYALNYQIKAH